MGCLPESTEQNVASFQLFFLKGRGLPQTEVGPKVINALQFLVIYVCTQTHHTYYFFMTLEQAKMRFSEKATRVTIAIVC